MNSEKKSRWERSMRALRLDGFWKLRWYHTVLIWLMLAVYGWGASPYLMVYVMGMPEPGTAPRYVGTIRVEGELERSRNGWKPPRYFFNSGGVEMEIHCGYLPSRKECWYFYDYARTAPENIYAIGYDRYWGVDYIKYPEELSPLDVNGSAKVVTFGRLLRLKSHSGDALWFCLWFMAYLWLIWKTYQVNASKREPSTAQVTSSTDS